MSLLEQMTTGQKIGLGTLVVALGAVAYLAGGLGQPPLEEQTPVAPPTAASTTTTGTSLDLSDEVQPWVVDVVGAVVRPGLVQVAKNSRVIHVIEAAGGLMPDADRSRINMAQRVSDGMQIIVPRVGENIEPTSDTGMPAAPLSINRATAEELQRLPGIGPTIASRIVEERQRRNGFRSLEELLEVAGISQSKFNQILPLISL